MLWEVDIHPKDDQPNREADRASADIRELHLADGATVAAARGYLLQGESLTADEAQRIANELLVDRVVEEAVVEPVGNERLVEPPGSRTTRLTGNPQSAIRNPQSTLVHVLPKPGVMDPVAQSAVAAIADCGIPCDAVRTLRKYWLSGVAPPALPAVCERVLANDAIEQVVIGPLTLEKLDAGSAYHFRRRTVPLTGLDDEQLLRLSRDGQLFLQLAEMQTIQQHFAQIGRDPTDVELETLAQTWSEHCSHKTLAGRIAYRDENGARHFENMLKETIFAATQTIRQRLGNDDWCVSVFEDNAGVIRFDDQNNLAFKVETHNHPSALEPYGGANTGIGGVIRDILGTGLGAKPIASTDIFCFAPPDIHAEDLPPGVLHPRRVMRGVVEGVRDYGNRMGIPTVNGAIYFDQRYLGNPLVYCGSLGVMPHDKSFGQPQPGDAIVAIGGRTGRDGIHGATFSSAELTSESEDLSGGAVQIGNAIEEKKVLDVLLAARDRGLYNAVTDCGAGGFSSAVGEMGEEIGAVVWLEKAPLKYEGLSYTEIWISEAQERMVFAVPPTNVDPFIALCEAEGVEAFTLGEFTPTGRLELTYGGEVVGDLSMEFLHNGRPPVVREAVFEVMGSGQWAVGSGQGLAAMPEAGALEPTEILIGILGSLNVASKEWVIRQYDHEVQGGSVVKPLVGVCEDGPSDAAVVRPVLGSRRGAVIACGMNPHYGDFDPYHMAASAIDEAIRNCVAVGADPTRIALLDNFCWGDCERPETLGALVRAAIACHDVAVELGTPFVSGKDSLNNEFSFTDQETGQRQTIAIPPTLLISAVGQVDDATKCVTMDLKSPGNLLYLVGLTKRELAGSHWHLITPSDRHDLASGRRDLASGRRDLASGRRDLASGRRDLASGRRDVASGRREPAVTNGEQETGDRRQEAGDRVQGSGFKVQVPTVDAPQAKQTFHAVHAAIQRGLVRACHDLSEGGLAVAAAEMCFAGGLGAEIELAAVPRGNESDDASVLLFSESNSRFLCEVPSDASAAFEGTLADVPCAKIGTVSDAARLCILGPTGGAVVDSEVETLKQAWKRPLAW